jgi:hypothetical protein
MSDLTDQLRSLRADYESARYPGDLASDVLGLRTWADRFRQLTCLRTLVPFPRAWSAAAVAASVLVGVFLYHPTADGVEGAAASLSNPLDSIRTAAQEVGAWSAHPTGGPAADARPDAGGRDAIGREDGREAGTDGFRIVPPSRRFDPPAPPPLEPDGGPTGQQPGQQESA